jgi:lipid II:glycine glycyltransferase (peptidoglycan interpeptide bridge formation enzyme)
MNTQQIMQMIAEVEDYIYRKKAVRVKIDPVKIFSNFDQLQKLIYAHSFTR